jgi:hypothetical protein
LDLNHPPAAEAVNKSDTTRFSVVVLQLQPTCDGFINILDTTGFSHVELQFQPSLSLTHVQVEVEPPRS